MTSIRIAILTDIHAAPAGWPSAKWHDVFEPAKGADLANAAVLELTKRDFDIAFVLGDITNNGDDASIDQALAQVVKLGATSWLVSGNHDLRVSDDALARGIERAEGPLQIPNLPGDIVKDDFIVAGLTYAGLTDADVRLTQRPDPAAWDDRAVLLLSHYPIISRRAESLAAGWKYAGDPKGLDGVADELAARSAPTLSFHGHLHLGDAVARGSYLQLGFPALAERGHHAAIVEIQQNDRDADVTVTPVVTSSDEHVPAAIGTPRRHWRFSDGEWRPD